ncbi:MAG: hypothetical protein HY600_01885 [Candidatus Omnitrophica bacterium]|nr:hypothetical protein [Candidatus Omnitrophota bacterium]
MPDVAQRFRHDLLPDEMIQWAGQPDPSVLFGPADLVLVPFSLLWGGFILVWEVTAIGAAVLSWKSGWPVLAFFPFFGLPFLIVGAYLTVGRFLYKGWRKRRTYYALTTRRALVLTEGRGRELQTEFLKDAGGISQTVRPNGIGTIQFGGAHRLSALYGNMGLDPLTAFLGKDGVTFFDIHEARRVYEMAMALKAG